MGLTLAKPRELFDNCFLARTNHLSSIPSYQDPDPTPPSIRILSLLLLKAQRTHSATHHISPHSEISKCLPLHDHPRPHLQFPMLLYDTNSHNPNIPRSLLHASNGQEPSQAQSHLSPCKRKSPKPEERYPILQACVVVTRENLREK